MELVQPLTQALARASAQGLTSELGLASAMLATIIGHLNTTSAILGHQDSGTTAPQEDPQEPGEIFKEERVTVEDETEVEVNEDSKVEILLQNISLFETTEELDAKESKEENINYMTSEEQTFVIDTLTKSYQLMSTLQATGESAQCENCDFSTETTKPSLELRKHEVGVHRKCQLCGNLHLSKEHLSTHIDEVHRRLSESFVCGISGCLHKVKSDKIKKLYTHIRTEHAKPQLGCDKCGQSFTQMKTLLGHLHVQHNINHTSIPAHSCEECGKVFKYANNLRLHIRSIHEKHPETLKCSSCDYISENLTNLRKHKMKVHEKEALQCNNCDFRTKSSANLAKHQERKHEGGKRFLCGFCSFTAKKRSQLVRHEFSHAEEASFMCDKCDFKTKAPDNLKVHALYHEEPRYYCDQCDYKSHSAGNFFTHKKVKHGTDRHECEQCGKHFVYKRHLLRHLVNHTDVKLPCSFCDKQFTRQDKLKEHLREAHGIVETKDDSAKHDIKAIDKSFSCTDCPKMFTNNKHLSRHKSSIHSSVLLSCPYCHKNFSRKDKLNIHISFSCKLKSSQDVL